MKVAYRPINGAPNHVELRDIGGADPLSVWDANDEREIASDAQCLYRIQGQQFESVPALDAIFSHGPSFVDASTGLNPNFVCADCHGPAYDETHLDRPKGVQRYYRVGSPDLDDPEAESAPRLCVADYLARYPQWIPQHRRDGVPEAIVKEANKRREARGAAKAPKAPPKEEPATTAPPEQKKGE